MVFIGSITRIHRWHRWSVTGRVDTTAVSTGRVGRTRIRSHNISKQSSRTSICSSVCSISSALVSGGRFIKRKNRCSCPCSSSSSPCCHVVQSRAKNSMTLPAGGHTIFDCCLNGIRWNYNNVRQRWNLLENVWDTVSIVLRLLLTRCTRSIKRSSTTPQVSNGPSRIIPQKRLEIIWSITGCRRRWDYILCY